MLKVKCILLLFLVLLWGGAALGQTAPAPSADAPASKIHITEGPADITLGTSQGHLNLPAGFKFLNKADTEEALRSSGEPVSAGVLGMVSDDTEGLKWFALLDYIECGYIRDDEADKMDAGQLLQSMKEGTAKDNEERRKQGGKDMEIVGWYKPPVYNHATHALSWSITAHDEGSTSQVINCTLLLLGRYGLMSCTVIGDQKDAAALQQKLDQMAAAINFPSGRDYASWRNGDKVAEVTMAGLVTGGAAAAAYGAAKVGLLGKLGNMFLIVVLALKKAFILVIAAIAGGIRWLKAKISGRSTG